MKLLLKNSSLIFSKYAEDLSEVFTNFDAAKHDLFMQTIGGKEGTIWQKIQLLYMPIYSTAADGNIYYDLKSGQIQGFEPDVAKTIWTENADASNSNVKGYTQTLNDPGFGVRILLQPKGINLTPSDACMFCLSTHNPNPSSSLNDAYIDFILDNEPNVSLEFKNRLEDYRINSVVNTTDSTEIVSQSKTTSGYGKIMAVCTSNVDGIISIASNNGSTVSASTPYSLQEGYIADRYSPCGRVSSSLTIYGGMFSIQGLAKGLTVAEAETIVNALEVFLT